MTAYFNKKRNWWQYQFRQNKKSYTKAGFKTKKEALAAEAEKKKEVKKKKIETAIAIEPVETDMDFLTLLNRRLDYIQAYRSVKYYSDLKYMAKRWAKEWNGKNVNEITSEMIIKYLIHLKKNVSAFSANKELRALKALWNFGIKPPNKWFKENPNDGIGFFPVEKESKYVPPIKDVIKVISTAEGEVKDYLWVIALTMGRMSEINQLEWKDVDFENGVVTLYTRKSRGGNLVPRKIPMCPTLNFILEKRFNESNKSIKWVFYHIYCSSKTHEWITGPYIDRKRIMTTLCKKAGVKYFRFHPLRHFGASILEKEGLPIKTIQELLGHANRATTEIYLHSFEGVNLEAMNLLGSALSGVGNAENLENARL
ncbi:MAG: site-specific integrase [Desulfamplus sp.]|nr:site-specific integrase [Desulfamplus sp.]